MTNKSTQLHIVLNKEQVQQLLKEKVQRALQYHTLRQRADKRIKDRVVQQ